MTDQETWGRRITLAIAVLVAVPNLALIGLMLLTGAPAAQMPWVPLGVSLVMSFLLFMGYKWARAYLIVSLCFGSVLFLMLLPLLGGNLVAAIVGTPFAIFYVAAGVVLWRSKAVEAYFDRSTASRDTLPSLRDLDAS